MKFKKVFAAFMAAAIVCGSTAMAAGAEEAKSLTAEKYYGLSVESDGRDWDWDLLYYDGCKYGLDAGLRGLVGAADGEYAVVGKKEVIIPSYIDGRSMFIIYPQGFVGLEDVEKIYIPSSIKSIYLGKDLLVPFARCSKLTDIYYEGTEEQWYDMQKGWIVEIIHVTEFNDYSTGDIRWDGRFTKDSNLWGKTDSDFPTDFYPTLHVNCKDINDEGTIVNFDSSSPTKEAAKPAKVSGIKKSRSNTTIKLSWNESKGAESYVIKYSTDKKTWKTKTVNTNSVKLSKLKAGTKYYFKVAAKNSSGTSAYSKVFSVTTKK